MKKRIITAIILALIIVPMIIVPGNLMKWVFEGFLILLAIGAELELLNMYGKAKKVPLAVKIICIAMMLLLFFTTVDNFSICTRDAEPSLIYMAKTNFNNFLKVIIPSCGEIKLDYFICLSVIFITVFTCMVFVPDFDAGDVGRCLLSIIYIAVCFSAITILREYGTRLIIFLGIVCCLTDTFALVFGLKFGKHKMAPKISPKKSWEGAIGGSVVATIAGFLFLFCYELFSAPFHGGTSVLFFFNVFDQGNFTKAGIILFMILISLFMSICGQTGDLVASKLKRTYGIKDYSNIFPGHGGILDRFDSILFSGAVFVVFLQFEALMFPAVI